MVDEHEAMSALERDVLLASSGELPWWRRPFLRGRIARSPRARELAAMLAALDETLSVDPASPKRWRWGPVVAVPVAAALVWVLWPTKPASHRALESTTSAVASIDERNSDESRYVSPDRQGPNDVTNESPAAPRHLELARLVIASARVGRVSSGWSEVESAELAWSPVPELTVSRGTLEVR